jgi:hypothetical protein
VDLKVDTSVLEEFTASTFSISALKMVAVYSSEMLVSTYKSTRHYSQKSNSDIFTALSTSYLRKFIAFSEPDRL